MSDVAVHRKRRKTKLSCWTVNIFDYMTSKRKIVKTVVPETIKLLGIFVCSYFFFRMAVSTSKRFSYKNRMIWLVKNTHDKKNIRFELGPPNYLEISNMLFLQACFLRLLESLVYSWNIQTAKVARIRPGQRSYNVSSLTRGNGRVSSLYYYTVVKYSRANFPCFRIIEYCGKRIEE